MKIRIEKVTETQNAIPTRKTVYGSVIGHGNNTAFRTDFVYSFSSMITDKCQRILHLKAEGKSAS